MPSQCKNERVDREVKDDRERVNRIERKIGRVIWNWVVILGGKV